ncbi:MAG: hypothetical protein KGL39_07305 [Patescibacteria group bacterium]|nr:hypothetical protein [Patescibacteria group bacterium]
MGGGGGGSSGPTVQQQQLETQQAKTNASLNLEENAQRKAILNAMLGTRVFRGSALSRAVRGDTPGTGGAYGTGPASAAQRAAGAIPITAASQSLLDTRSANASGATPAGGTGASGTGAFGGAVRGGGSGRGQIP